MMQRTDCRVNLPRSTGRHFWIWDECIQAFALLLSLLSNANAQKIRDCNSLLEELHCDSATRQNTEGNDLKQYWEPYQTILGTILDNTGHHTRQYWAPYKAILGTIQGNTGHNTRQYWASYKAILGTIQLGMGTKFIHIYFPCIG